MDSAVACHCDVTLFRLSATTVSAISEGGDSKTEVSTRVYLRGVVVLCVCVCVCVCSKTGLPIVLSFHAVRCVLADVGAAMN